MKKIILIACSILAGCSSPNRSLEQALKQAIAFEAEPKQIKKVFSEFAEIGQEERTARPYPKRVSDGVVRRVQSSTARGLGLKWA